jgi:hypothetical protein
MRRELFEKQDEIDENRDRLIDGLEQKTSIFVKIEVIISIG